MRLPPVARMLAIGLILFGASGCEKVPTWGELTSGQQAPPAAPTQTVPQVPVVTPVQEAPPPVQRSEEVIAKFQSLRSAEISDTAINQLTSLTEGLDQITEINADGSQVSKDAFGSISKLTNLRQLRLNGSRVDNDACAKIAQVSGLEVLALTGTAVSDAGVAALTNLPNLKQLELNRCKLTKNGFAAIGSCPALKTLHIESTNLDNQSLDLVCNANTLTVLWLKDNPINDFGLIALKKLGTLEYLELSCPQITGEGLMFAKKGAGLKSLIGLGMYACPLNEAGAKAISEIKSLEGLNIGGIPLLNDVGFSYIVTGMKKLTYVNLSGCSSLDGSGLIALKGCKDLEKLYIDQCPMMNDSLIKELKKFKNLKVLTTGGTAITARGIAELQAALPECKVN